jgi:hypothetical protein
VIQTLSANAADEAPTDRIRPRLYWLLAFAVPKSRRVQFRQQILTVFMRTSALGLSK